MTNLAMCKLISKFYEGDCAGVTQRVAMKISGHETDSVFRRYDIVDLRDLADATKKLESTALSHRQAKNEQEQGAEQNTEQRAEVEQNETIQ